MVVVCTLQLRSTMLRWSLVLERFLVLKRFRVLRWLLVLRFSPEGPWVVQ